jgi:hypothetical protein
MLLSHTRPAAVTHWEGDGMVSGTPEPLAHRLDGGGPYRIHVQGAVERHWEADLRMQLTYQRTEAGTITVLAGWLPDQAALLGALARLAMWGYLILLVRYEPELQQEGALSPGRATGP